MPMKLGYLLARLGLASFLAGAAAIPAAAQELIEGKHYEIVPAVYSGIAPITPLGADKAKGVILWSHGRGNAAASEKAPPIALYFAQRGWDVFGAYRGFGVDDRARAQQIVQISIEWAKARGYRRIVLMGQSAGAYASVEAVRYGAEVEGIVALAPAAHGSGGGGTASPSWRQNDYAMRAMWERYEGKKLKVVTAYFSGDDFYEAHLPNVRGPWLKARLDGYGIPNYIISQPENGGLTGHGAGQYWNFARRFGPCIFGFVETGAAPPCAEDDPATLATFEIKLPPPGRFDGAEPFAGRWYGTWSGGRLVAIPIFRREGDKYPARYISGIGGSLNEKAEDLDWPLTADGSGIRRETSNTIFTFTLDGPDRLVGTRTPKKNPADKQTIVMRRAP